VQIGSIGIREHSIEPRARPDRNGEERKIADASRTSAGSHPAFLLMKNISLVQRAIRKKRPASADDK